MITPDSGASAVSPPSDRRHDLDALRAFAMLLGIVLHGAMSFIPGAGFFWGVQDSQSSPLYGLLLSSIHGWRMPLFFLISGFFTAMLWNKRGLRALMVHRFKRIFLPMILSMVTIIPLLWGVSVYVRTAANVDKSPSQDNSSTEGPADNTSPTIEEPEVDIFAVVATGDEQALATYFDQGGDVDAKNDQGATLMHVACLFGRSDVAGVLLKADANLEARNKDGARPIDLLALDWGTTQFIAKLVQLQVEEKAVMTGRKRIADMIGEQTGRKVATSPQAVDRSPGLKGLIALLFYFPVFHHLWFLWFLCWLVLGFVLVVKLAQKLTVPAPPTWLITSVARYVWLIPLTAIPQYFMGSSQYSYGPDTSVGLLPLPAVLAYYSVFFAYGVFYFSANDQNASVGRGFWWLLPFALVILFPLGIALQGPESTGDRVLYAVMQVSYTWAMSFGMIGLFHRCCSLQRNWVRYLSDSSYWLYLAHLPLVMLVQFWVRDWTLPSPLKFAFVCSVTTGLLLISYQLCVRNTWIGALLNGRRYPGHQPATVEPSEPSHINPEAALESRT